MPGQPTQAARPATTPGQPTTVPGQPAQAAQPAAAPGQQPQAAQPTAAPGQPAQPAQPTATPGQPAPSAPAEEDDGPDLIFFTPDPKAQQPQQGTAPQPAQPTAAPGQPAQGTPKPQGQPAAQAKPGQPQAQPAKPGQPQAAPQTGAQPQQGQQGVHLKTERKEAAHHAPPPDIPPAQLGQLYAQGLGTARARCVGGLVLSAMLLIFALLESGFVVFLRDIIPEAVLVPGSLVLFLLAALVCQDVLKAGLIQLTNKAPDADTLALFATVFTVVDGLSLLLFHLRAESLPFFAPCAVMLTFHQIGHTCGRAAKAISCEVAAASPRGYVVTQDPNVLGSQTAFRKWLSTPQGFGSQIRTASGPYRQFQKLTPVLLTACFLIALVTTILHRQPRLVFWSLSGLFTTASTLGAALAFDLPFRMAAGRLRKLGAALAGWPGLEATKGGRSVLLGDYDLYPPGAIVLTDAKPMGGSELPYAVSLAASAIRASGSGLGTLFERLRQKTRASYVPVARVEILEHGVIAHCPDGSRILVGTAAFMTERAVPLPQGIKGKDVIFCAHGMQPVGMFALRYDLHPAVVPCLQGLFLHKLRPILATRDFNLSPIRLRARSKLPLDDDCFPDLGRRVNLSAPDRPHGEVRVAYLTREGLLSYSQALISAKRVHRASRISSVFVRLGAVIGVFLAATLSSAGATGAMCAWNLSLFLLLWLVPVLLLSLWAWR